MADLLAQGACAMRRQLVGILTMFALNFILGCGSGIHQVDFSILPSTPSVSPGSEIQLTTTNRYLTGTWSLTDIPKIGEISASGIYKAPAQISQDEVAHVAFSCDGVTKTAEISINKILPKISSASYIFHVNGTIVIDVIGQGFSEKSIAELSGYKSATSTTDPTHIQIVITGASLVQQTIPIRILNSGSSSSNVYALLVQPPSVKSISISGISSAITSDKPALAHVTAVYSNGESADITLQAVYTYDKSVISEASGYFSCNHSGSTVITASLNDSSINASVSTMCILRSPHQARGPLEHSKSFEGPFTSWINVVRDFGAHGDGIHDDTISIQKALDAARMSHSAVYIPSGIYIISQTLTATNLAFYSVIGQDPLTTEIRWNGPDNGTMFLFGGTVHFSIGRLKFNGQSKAQIGIRNTWTPGGNYPTKNLIHDIQIVDVAVGIRNDFAGETTVDRAYFKDNTQAAIALTDFNALNFNVIDSIFEDCNIGVTNTLWNGAGAFNVANSIFMRSKIADFYIGNTGSFLFKSNISINSAQFLIEGETSNASTITIQNNDIYHSGKYPIDMRNLGPLTLIDNLFQQSDISTPIVYVPTGTPGAIIAVGNRYETLHPYIGRIRSLTIFDETPGPVPTEMPVVSKEVYVPQSDAGGIIEIPVGSGSSFIQRMVDAAPSTVTTVLHFPVGHYRIDSPIRIPAGKKLHLLGDNAASTINPANGFSDSMFVVEGGQIEIENLMINGNLGPATAITVAMKDDPSTHIIVDETDINSMRDQTSSGVVHPGLDYTSFESKVLAVDAPLGIQVAGGELQKNHEGHLTRVSYFLGGTGYYEVSTSGELLVEGAFHDVGNGPRAFTISGDAKVSHQSGTIFTNAISGNSLSNFSGTLALIGLPSDTQIMATSSNSGNVLFAGSVLSRTDGSVVVPQHEDPSLWSLSSLQLNYNDPTHLQIIPNSNIPASLASAFAFSRTRYMGYRSRPTTSSNILRLSGLTIWLVHKSIDIQPSSIKNLRSYDLRLDSSQLCSTDSIFEGTKLVPDDDGSYSVLTNFGFLSENSTDHAISVVPNAASAYERWFIEPAANGTFQISNRATSYSLVKSTSGCPEARMMEGKDASGWQLIPK